MSAAAAPARSCAAAGAAGTTSRTAVSTARRRRPMRAITPACAQTCGLRLGGDAGLGDLEDLFEADGPVGLVETDQAARSDARAVDVDVDRIVGRVVEVDDRAVAEGGDVGGAQLRAAELGPDAQRHVAQSLADRRVRLAAGLHRAEGQR